MRKLGDVVVSRTVIRTHAIWENGEQIQDNRAVTSSAEVECVNGFSAVELTPTVLLRIDDGTYEGCAYAVAQVGNSWFPSEGLGRKRLHVRIYGDWTEPHIRGRTVYLDDEPDPDPAPPVEPESTE